MWIQWQAWASRHYAQKALEAVQREIACQEPQLTPGGRRLATIACPDTGRSFIVLRGRVLEIVDTTDEGF